MAKKENYWRTRILFEGEQRYLDQVIRPALDDLETTRASLQKKMPNAESGDADIVALFQAELERVDAVEARLRGHMSDTVNRFGRRRSGESAG